MVEFLFSDVAALKTCNFIKKKLRHRCFPVNIVKFLRTPFLQNTSGGCFCNVQVIVLCNIGPSKPKQNCIGYFPSKSLLRTQGQYDTSNFLVQCCLRCIWTTLSIRFSYAEAIVRRCSVKKVFLKKFKKFKEEHLCQSLFLNKVADLRPVTLLKKRLWHRYFSVNFAKFLRTPFFTEHVWATASVCNVFCQLWTNIIEVIPLRNVGPQRLR